MAVLLGLLVALTYGSGDFCGGVASTRIRASAVMVGSFALSGALLLVVTAGWWAIGGLPAATGRDLALGVAAGCIGPIAVGLLYAGLAAGRMSVVAPITAVVAAIVPFAWGVASGERPGAVAIAGVALALLAVALISGAPEHGDRPEAVEVEARIEHRSAADLPAVPDAALGSSTRRLVLAALGSGLGFGIVFVLLGATTDDAGLWPLVAARSTAVVGSVAVLALWAAAGRGELGPNLVPIRASWAAVAGAGVFDITANAIYLAATRTGLLSIVAVLSSLYPAATVVLARVVLGERLHRQQVLGLGVAVAGVVAMTTG